MIFQRLFAAIYRVGRLRFAIILLIGAIVTCASFAIAMIGVTRTKNPNIALAINSNDGVALAKVAEAMFLSNPLKPPAQITDLARKALQVQGANARALRLLGSMFSVENPDSEQARHLMKLATRLTRRDAGAQLWLVQDAARRSDYPAAMANIDTLLRTLPESEDTLFPIMLRGLDDPQFRAMFRRYRKGAPIWVGNFLSYSIANAPNLDPVVEIVVSSGGFPDVPKAAAYGRQLLDRLGKAGQFDEVAQIYRLMPGADLQHLTRAGFDVSDIEEYSGVVGWQVFDGPDAGASFVLEKGREDPIMTVYVNSGTTRPVASKLLYLRPGGYLLSVEIDQVDAGEGGSLSWRLRCPAQSDKSPIQQGGNLKVGRNSAPIVVPNYCAVQFLDIVTSGGDGQRGLEATVLGVTLANRK